MKIRNIFAIILVVCMVSFTGSALFMSHKASAREDERKSINALSENDAAGDNVSSDDGQENEDTAIEIEHKENEENNIHQDLNNIQENLKNNELLEIESSKFSTYGDVVSMLKNLQKSLNDIKSSANLQSQTAALNASEKALFANLLKAHAANTDIINSRVDELNGGIQELIDLLSPIADQPISEVLGLKKLLISEVKDFRDQIEKIKTLSDLEIETIDAETQ